MLLSSSFSVLLLSSDLAPTGASDSLDLFGLMMGLLGGLALFLFGMGQMSEALKAVAGHRMKNILAKLTKHRISGAITGAFVTAVIQSSSITTVLVVGFITAGLMSMSQSVGVIMGANIGTTFTAQIIAFKVTKYALLMIATGFGMSFISKRESTRQYGTGLMGLGLIFFGMAVMGDAMKPLRSYEPFLDLMMRMESPFLGILIAALFTALVQSSSATTGIVIVMATQGLITLEAGIALAFGANIGTCVTALLASIGKPREALRAALVHVLFNVLGVLAWIGLIEPLAEFVTWLSPISEGLTGGAKLAAETPRQIANAHTTFNIANTLLFLPLATQFARFVEYLVPDRPIEEEEQIRARYLDSELLSTPALALDRARLELQHLGERIETMLVDIFSVLFSGSITDLEGVAEQDDAVDLLHGKIITYLGKVGQTRLTSDQTAELIKLMQATNDLENIGDIIETNMVALGRRRINSGIAVSGASLEVLRGVHREVLLALESAMLAVTQKDEQVAQAVVGMKARINELVQKAAHHQATRLIADEPNRVEAYSFEMDVIENLRRVFYFCKRMARAAVPDSVGKQEMDPS